MRLVIQRVRCASVSVDGDLVSSIGPGLCVLVGISRDDTEKDAEYMCRKLLNVRLFDSVTPVGTCDVTTEGTVDVSAVGTRWSCSVTARSLDVLCISQFTLYGQLKGNKPDFRNAMSPADARQFYHSFLQKLRSAYEPDKIKDGVFAKAMQVSLVNDGPVTLTLESPHSVPSQADQ